MIRKFISTIVNVIEKVSSLLTWVDPNRTILILILLFIVSGVANTFLIRGIVILFSIHRLYKGMNFYREKHYKSNRRFAIYATRYIINKCYPQMVSKINLKLAT